MDAPRPKFREGQLVSGPGFAWYRVERIHPAATGTTYDLREVISKSLRDLGETPHLKPTIAEEHVRTIPTHNDRLAMTGAELRIHEAIELRTRALLAEAMARHDNTTPLPEHVITRTSVEVLEQQVVVKVKINAAEGRLVGWVVEG